MLVLFHGTLVNQSTVQLGILKLARGSILMGAVPLVIKFSFAFDCAGGEEHIDRNTQSSVQRVYRNSENIQHHDIKSLTIIHVHLITSQI